MVSAEICVALWEQNKSKHPIPVVARNVSRCQTNTSVFSKSWLQHNRGKARLNTSMFLFVRLKDAPPGGLRSGGGFGCCSVRVACCSFLLLVLCVIVAGLSVYTYSMNKDLQALKSQVQAQLNSGNSLPGQ